MTYREWVEEQGAVHVWEDQMEAYALFRAMETQWTVGMAGPVGLNYSSIPELWRRLRIPRERRDEAFSDLQLMERAALEAGRGGDRLDP